MKKVISRECVEQKLREYQEILEDLLKTKSVESALEVLKKIEKLFGIISLMESLKIDCIIIDNGKHR